MRNSEIGVGSVNFFLLGTAITVAGPVDEVALKVEAKGSDPAKLSVPGLG